jgi:zinc transport system substrate-binding protein
MKKVFKLVLITICIITMTTGCFKRDNLEDATIYTSAYPALYITSRLYGDHSTIKSIYPDGVNPSNYKPTDKQLRDYSDGDIFIFNGLTDEKGYVTKLLKYNKNLKIIDMSLAMEYNNEVEEIWMAPSNFLMLSQNIKNGLLEYINNHYLQEEIKTNYDNLKLDISNLDAKLNLLSSSSNDPTIVVANDAFKFLEKYGFNVISLENNDNLTDKTIYEVRSLMRQGKINYIYIRDDNDVNKIVNRMVKDYNVELVKLNTISSLTTKQKTNKEDYITIMNENIELLKNEIYD